MKKANLAVLALLVVAFSCKKSDSTPTPPAAAVTYMALSASSTRTYETQNNVTVTTTSNVLTSTSRDSIIGGKTYHVFTNSNGTANDYYNISGSDYYTYKVLAAGLGINAMETIYLNDNTAVNGNWSQTINIPVTGFPAPIPATFTNTVTEKGINRTVNSIVYSNVIHTTTTISVTGLPVGSITTDIQSYYAPNVGLIENKYKVSIPSLTINSDQTTILKSAVIL